jgi:tRNA pseudouridine55 synthase
MRGILNINKPRGWTSRDVVNRIERLVRPAKAGHAGTLDPLATGVLAVCIGQATRLIEYLQAGRKQYRGTFWLGRESDTEDITGEVRELPGGKLPTRAAFEAALPAFVGEQMQRPPAYSALKVQGKRAYSLARQGQHVELAPRPIEIFALRLVGYAWPEVVLDIECSSGTYVRSLGRDLAASLGTAAVMSGLVRTAVGPLKLESSIELDSLTKESIAPQLLPAELAVAHLPRLILSGEDILRATQGKRIALRDAVSGEEAAALDAAGRLIAILKRRGDAWHPDKVFA